MLRPNDDPGHRTALLAWLAVGAVLRLAYLQEQAATSVLFYQPLLDEQEMLRSAEALLRGEGFGPEPLFKAPLYPILLSGVIAVTGSGWFWAMRFLQHLMGVLLIAVAWDTSKRLLPPGRPSFVAANVAAGIVAVYAPLIRLENQLILDSLVVVFQSAMLWALLRMRLAGGSRAALMWAAGAGILAALAWLNRPTITPVIPILALWIVGVAAWRARWNSHAFRHRLIRAGIFLLFPALAVAGFATRNAMVSGEALYLPWQGSYSFYEANKPGATGRYFHQPSFVVSHGGNPARELAVQGYERAVEHNLVTVPEGLGFYGGVDWYWKNTSFRAISNPWSRWIKLMIRKTVYLGTDKEIFNFEEYDIHKSSSWVLRWLPLSFGWLFPLALASLAFWSFPSRGRRDLVALIWIYTLVLGAAIALYFTSGRLRMPLMFPAAILVSIFVAQVMDWLQTLRPLRMRSTHLAAIVGIMIFGFSWSWGDWWGVRSERLHFADYERLSNAAYMDQNPERALEYADLAFGENPNSVMVPMLRGQALYLLDRMEEAEAAFRESTETVRSDAIAPFNLGMILYYERENPQEAFRFFAEAVTRNPNYVRARAMAALSAIRLGEPENAVAALQPFIDAAELPPDRTLHIALISLHTVNRDEIATARATQRFVATFGTEALASVGEELRLVGLLE